MVCRHGNCCNVEIICPNITTVLLLYCKFFVYIWGSVLVWLFIPFRYAWPVRTLLTHQWSRNRPFSLKTFWHVTVGNASALIIKLMMAEFHLAASASRSCYCACWLTVTLSRLTETLEHNTSFFTVISNTCAFPTMTSQNVCCEKGVHTMLIKSITTSQISLYFAVYRSFYIWCRWRHSHAGASVVMCFLVIGLKQWVEINIPVCRHTHNALQHNKQCDRTGRSGTAAVLSYWY